MRITWGITLVLVGIVSQALSQTAPALDLTGCGTSKGCMKDPSTCTDTSNCNAVATWLYNSTTATVSFEMFGAVPGYVALGLSDDNQMGSDSVMQCTQSGGTVTVQYSYNTGKSNALLANPTADITMSDWSYTANKILCRFSRAVTITRTGTDAGKIASLSKSGGYYLLLARASTVGAAGALTYHSGTKAVSGNKIDPTAAIAPVTTVTEDQSKLKAHACLMITAWVILASVGILMARYYKDAFGDKELCSVKVWFAVHRFTMVLVLACTAIGFIVIFTDVMGYSDLSSENSPQQAHAPLGIVVMILVVANPVMSLFRCAPNTSKRPIFNWGHWLVGIAAYTIGTVNIYLGVTMKAASGTTTPWLIWVMVAHTVFHFLTSLTLELYQCYAKKKTQSADIAMKQPGEQDPPQTSATSTFELMVLAVHVISVVALGLTLIITIAVTNNS